MTSRCQKKIKKKRKICFVTDPAERAPARVTPPFSSSSSPFILPERRAVYIDILTHLLWTALREFFRLVLPFATPRNRCPLVTHFPEKFERKKKKRAREFNESV